MFTVSFCYRYRTSAVLGPKFFLNIIPCFVFSRNRTHAAALVPDFARFGFVIYMHTAVVQLTWYGIIAITKNGR